MSEQYTQSESHAFSHRDIESGPSPEVILHANKAESERLQTYLQQTSLSQSERDAALGRIQTLGATERYAKKWQRMGRNGGEPEQSFNDFISQELDDAFETDDENAMDMLSKVDRWVGSAGFERQIQLADETIRNERAASMEKQRASAETLETAQREHATTEARQTVENVYENNELLANVLKVTRGKTAINTDYEGGFQDVGDSTVNRDERAKLFNIPDLLRQKSNEVKNASEVVTFTTLQEYDTRDVDVQVGWEKKGVFGKQVPQMGTRKEAIPGSEHDVLMVNPQTGNKEPVVRFRYMFGFSDQDRRREGKGGARLDYISYNDPRPGNSLRIGVDLPKSIADMLQAQITEDPTVARLVAERLLLTNNKSGINEQDWIEGRRKQGKDAPLYENSGRMKPPYENLPDDWSVLLVSGKESDYRGLRDVTDYTATHLK